MDRALLDVHFKIDFKIQSVAKVAVMKFHRVDGGHTNLFSITLLCACYVCLESKNVMFKMCSIQSVSHFRCSYR